MEFSENLELFKVFKCIHVKYTTGFCGILGIIATIAVFGFGVVIFPWNLYETAVNVTAMTAFACFLVGGVTVHILILHGLYEIRFRSMIPAILYQSFLMCLNAITTLIAIGELVSENELSPRDEKMARIVICVCPTILVIQSLVLISIGKCRLYLQCKRRHIRNGLPPPVREVIIIPTNKVSHMELSVDDSYAVAETMMPN